MFRLVVSALILFFSSAQFIYGQSKRSINLFEKEKYEQAFDLLYKELSKDSLDPETKYTLSLFYLVDTLPYFNIDTSYYFITSALVDFDLLEEKDFEKYQKEGFTLDTINLQKAHVETYAFKRTQEQDTESAYIEYLVSFPESILEDSAIYFRNKRGFEIASTTNTWEGYLSFMNRYPEAEDYAEAEKRYNLLLYNKRTSDGKLSSLESFLNDYPFTPHRRDCEERIFRIRTGNHSSESYLDFLDRYPNTHLKNLVADRLYHLNSRELSVGFDYPANLRDSLFRISNIDKGPLIPFVANGLFGFYDQDFEEIIVPRFDRIDADYLCGDNEDDLLLVYQNDIPTIINREGYTVQSNTYSFNDLGKGLISYSDNDSKYGVLHKSGNILINPYWDHISGTSKGYLKVRKDNKWGLHSISDISILESEFDSIYFFNKTLITETEESYNFYLETELDKGLDGIKPTPFLSTDDYISIDSVHLLSFKEELEGLVTFQGDMLIPHSNQSIYIISEEELLIKRDSSTFIYSLLNHEFNEFEWKGAKYNSNWLGLSINNKWFVKNLNNGEALSDLKDSVALLTETIVWTRQDKMDTIYFANGKQYSTTGHSDLNILTSKTSHDGKGAYVVFKDTDHLLLNYKGDSISIQKNYTLEPLGENSILTKYRRKYGLCDADGFEILKPRYDIIASSGEKNLVDVLVDKKFGLYRFSDSLFIEPMSDRRIQFYNDSIYIVIEDYQQLIYHVNGDPLSDVPFDELKPFNDTTAFVRVGDDWQLRVLASDSILVDHIKQIKMLSSFENKSSYKVFTEDGSGILDNTNGLIIAPTYNEIINIGTDSYPLYIGEKYVSEANYYVLVYFNASGKILKRNAYPAEEYRNLMCEN